ncbi:MAG: hypothetical protein PHX78_02045 [bacterium]|nr:hypothetical protein [bacterium]
MIKQNCWEFKKCGREEGGIRVPELGVCPAAVFTAGDGFCSGKNGGRACVYITGTFCAGVIQGTYREKAKECGECDFYNLLKQEHGKDLTVMSFNRYARKK